MTKDPNGFTLIEVLVALVIFSVMAIKFTSYIQLQTEQTSYLTDKTLATVVATNAITELRAGDWPPVGISKQTVSMAEKKWQLDISVELTSSTLLRKIRVTVNTATQPALVTYTGYAGKIP